MAEIHFRHVADFIVIVEHHATMTGDAKVFEQHVAGKNIGGGKLANRVAVLLNRIPQLLTFCLFKPEIEWHHSPLNIEMADDNLLAKIGHLFRHFLK